METGLTCKFNSFFKSLASLVFKDETVLFVKALHVTKRSRRRRETSDLNHPEVRKPKLNKKSFGVELFRDCTSFILKSWTTCPAAGQNPKTAMLSSPPKKSPKYPCNLPSYSIPKHRS